MIPGKIFLIPILFFSVPSMADTSTQSIVAVFDVSVQGISLPKGVVKLLGDYLAGRLATCDQFKVVPRYQVKERLAIEKTSSHKDCYDQSCQIELGKALAADRSLSTIVMKLGSVCEVSSSLYDLRTETTVKAAAVEGLCTDDGLRKSMQTVVVQLCNSTAPPTGVQMVPAAASQAEAPQNKPASFGKPEDMNIKPLDFADIAGLAPLYNSRENLYKAIPVLENLINATDDDDPSRPEYIARLAQVCWDLARSTTDQVEKDRLTGTTIDLYKAIIEKYPKYSLVDEVLCNQSKTFVLAGRGDLAFQYLAQLIRSYPNSSYVPDALQLLGDYYFGQNDFDGALKLYSEAELFKQSTSYGLAAHRKAWCQFRMGDIEAARAQIAKVIDYAQSPAGRVCGYSDLLLQRSREFQNALSSGSSR